MELSNLEVKILASILNKELKDYYVNNVYSITEDIIMVKFHHPIKNERRLMITPNCVWLTKYELEKREPTKFVTILREYINRLKFEEAEQPNFERIIFIRLSSKQDTYYLIFELFGKGNIILADKEKKIIALLNKLKVKHRELDVGKIYSLPPQKGINPFNLNKYEFFNLIEGKEVFLALLNNLPISKKFLKEILFRAEVDPSKKNLEEKEKERIYEELIKILNLQDKGYLVYKGEELIDLLPFEFKTYQDLRKVAKEDFNDALDDFMKNELEKILNKEERKVLELEASIDKNIKLAQDLRKIAENLRKIAENIYLNPLENFEKLLEDIGKLVRVKREEKGIVLSYEKEEIISNPSPLSLSSSLFDLSKRLEKKAQRIDQVVKELEAKKNKLRVKEKRELKEVREKFWFERFRWFYTSDDLLAIGGRDAHSNSSLIRKYLDEEDLVFHADLHGSPFFLLKGGSKNFFEKSIYEVAQATVSFSRAWKEGFSIGDAYWVKPEQVKKAAPSGLYLPKGSFLIEGKKNYIKGLKLQIALGLIPVKDNLLISSGPPEAIKKRALAYVEILPTNEELSKTAKKIKKEFEELLGKEVNLDDIIRALPPAGGKIVAKGKKK
ncbi:hypothetical protein HRbin06_00111 [archaeon HR06]|nr:hypothetical protein HRbin06_00111 [archaeon HR06]